MFNLKGGMDEVNRLTSKLVEAMQSELCNVYKDIDEDTENAIWDEFQTIISEELQMHDYNNHM